MIRAAFVDLLYWSSCFCGFCFAVLAGKNALLPLGVVGATLLLFPVYQSVRRGRFEPFDPPTIALIFTFQQLLRPFYWYSQGTPELVNFSTTADRALRVSEITAVYLYAGYSAYYFAYYAFPSSKELIGLFPRFEGGWSNSRAKITISCYLLVGLVSYVLFMRHVGGIAYYVSHIYMRAQLAEGLGPLGMCIELFAVGTLLLLCYWMSGGISGRVVFIVTLCAVGMIATLGGRGHLILPFLIGAICWHYCVRRISILKLASLGLGVVIFAVAFVTLRSGTSTSEAVDVDALQKQSWTAQAVIDSYFHDQNQLDSFGVLVADMPRQISFQFGGTWLRMLTLPVPSKLWVHKPILLEGRMIGETYFGDKSGIPPGFAGTLYMNFHFPGILAGFFFLGVFHKSLREYLSRNKENVRCVCFYAVTAVLLYEITNIALINWFTYAPFLLVGFWLVRGNELRVIRLWRVRTSLGTGPISNAVQETS